MTVNVLWIFLAMPWVGLQCVIVVFPDHNPLLYWSPSAELLCYQVNPYKLDGISHYYELDQSISVLRVVG